MHIVAISLHVPSGRDAKTIREPRETVTIRIPSPTCIDAAAVSALSGRGVIVDVLC